ncbi:MAG: CDP-2,3-bis-(O-geranylgeranyl)-sn-glycerol synthase [Candidatus Aenigmarchaeota archaeon]|nr:CDP-2,3-bis-(O-geranylgeranyl)-sn-glycerol synthase [Candidatus Aenigmarchaeota archaeon]
MSFLPELIIGLWIIIPAYAANGFAPLAHGKRRMDFGKKFSDGRDIFGKGKTWEGFVFAIFVGVVVGLIEMALYPYVSVALLKEGLTVPRLSLLSVFLISFGAMVGDLVGSFIKRRVDIESGEPAPLLDQLDFVFGAFFFASLVMKLTALSFVLITIITPIIHVIASIIGHKIGAKKVPW